MVACVQAAAILRPAPSPTGPCRGGKPRVSLRTDTQIMQTIAVTTGLLCLSNIFMTFAWYAHLKELYQKPWLVAALVSWGIALFEYLLQVPAHCIGFTVFSVAQLKILQEIITLSVFVPFAFFYLKEPLKLDYLWAALCILGAVYFVFRGKLAGA